MVHCQGSCTHCTMLKIYYPGQKKKEPSPRFAARRTLFQVWYHARWRTIKAGQSHPQLSATFALRWSCVIEHDITRGTAFFSPRISGMVLFFFVQGSIKLNGWFRWWKRERFHSNFACADEHFLTHIVMAASIWIDCKSPQALRKPMMQLVIHTAAATIRDVSCVCWWCKLLTISSWNHFCSEGTFWDVWRTKIKSSFPAFTIPLIVTLIFNLIHDATIARRDIRIEHEWFGTATSRDVCWSGRSLPSSSKITPACRWWLGHRPSLLRELWQRNSPKTIDCELNQSNIDAKRWPSWSGT